MADSNGTKYMLFALLAFVVVLTYCQRSAMARPNSKRTPGKSSDGLLQRSHKGKRTWDTPFPSESQDEPTLLEESEIATPSSEPAADTVWLSIGDEFPETKQLVQNSDGELVCEAVGSPAPRIFWLKDGQPVDSMRVVSNDESMRNRVDGGNNVVVDRFLGTGMANVKSKFPIKCAQPGDEGRYTCVAINRGKETRATTYVTVIDDPTGTRGSCDYRLSTFSFKKPRKGLAPHIVNSETFHMETMDQHIALPCRSVGRPKPQTTWLDQDGKKVLSGKKYQVSSSGTLIIRKLAWTDMGVYTCISENAYGSDTTSTFVYTLAESDNDS